MRNTVISIVCMVLITVYTAFSAVFISRFADEIEGRINYADKNGYTADLCSSLQETLDKNMSLLLLTTSKEHIDFMEECVVNIQLAAQYHDMQNVLIYRKLLLNTINEIDRTSKSPV